MRGHRVQIRVMAGSVVSRSSTAHGMEYAVRGYDKFQNPKLWGWNARDSRFDTRTSYDDVPRWRLQYARQREIQSVLRDVDTSPTFNPGEP